MADVVIRDVPDDVLAAIDAAATRLGLSRDEYLLSALRRVAQPVSVADLKRFADRFGDLADPDVMDQAWK